VPGEADGAAAVVADALAGTADSDAGQAVLDAVADRDGPVIVVLGRESVAEHAGVTVYAASLLARGPETRFLSALPVGNVHGALDLGLTPGFLPGRVTLDAGRDHVRATWGSVPDQPGLDASGILDAAAHGQVDTLVLVGCDPLAECPDRALARAALEQVDTVIAVTPFLDGGAERAAVVLPPTVWGEQAGTTTNLEGRVVRVGRRVAPEGSTLEGWRIPVELAARLGSDLDLETLDEVQDEIAAVAPAFAGADADLLRRARDGVVLPLAEHAADVTFGPGGPTGRASWEPIPPTPESPEPARDRVEEPPAPPVALHRWDGTSEAPAVTPVDAYALRLVAGHALYGADAGVAATPALAARLEEPTLGISPRDRERLGVADGTRVRVTSARGAVELPIRTDPRVAAGTAFIAANLAGPGAGDLIDAAAPVTEVRVENLS